ncbi:cytoskeleton-associated protein 2-like [Pithys albifrons albifrons]|uniref:cytoskeleton-associated protein 2-like n=1 Tax=Pithys albifrons albifrons TaxID=3385563 RepID=UPI003A5D18DC
MTSRGGSWLYLRRRREVPVRAGGSRPFLKDWMDHSNPPLEVDSKLKHVGRKREIVLGNVTEGAQGVGRLGAKSTQHTAHSAQQEPSNTSQRAVEVPPVPPWESTKLPTSAQTRGRLPPPSSGHLNPERGQNSAQETGPAAALRVGRDHSPLGAPCSLNERLQHGLVCHKENLRPRACTAPKPNRAFQPDGSSLGKKRVSAHRQSSATRTRPLAGPEDSLKHQRQPAPGRSSPTKPPAPGRSWGTASLKCSLQAGDTIPRPMAEVEMAGKDMGMLLSSEQLKPEQLRTSVLSSLRVPRTPSAADRRKQLEEWVALKGRKYKRPSMRLLQKQAAKPPCRIFDKRKDPAKQSCLRKINRLLNQRLKFVEEPVQELREVVPDVWEAADHTSEVEKPEQPVPCEPGTPWPGEKQRPGSTFGSARSPLTSLPRSVKLQVTSVSRGREVLEGPELKYLTPVRRSLRVQRAGSCYPEMLRDHDPVVSSLSEILDAEKDTQFFFRRNKALPEVTELKGLSSYPTGTG